MKQARSLVVVLLAIGIAVAAALAWRGFGAREAAPTVSYTLLDGSTVGADQLAGKVVLVNFWATSCTTCVREMPHLVETHEKFAPRGYATIAVAMDYDRPEYVAHFAQTRKLPFAVAFDRDGSIARSYGDVRLTPTTFLIDKRGAIVKRYVGEPDFDALHRLVERLLAEG